jgi:hypothetical protein
MVTFFFLGLALQAAFTVFQFWYHTGEIDGEYAYLTGFYLTMIAITYVIEKGIAWNSAF